MLKVENGIFVPNLNEQERQAVKDAAAILDAMSRVGLFPKPSAKNLQQFAAEHCWEDEA